MTRQSVEWPRQREADVEDVHLEILGIALRGSVQWQGRVLREAEIACVVSPRGNQPLPPVGFDQVRLLGEDDKPLSGWGTSGGVASEHWRNGI
jgi:hypothetical protein